MGRKCCVPGCRSGYDRLKHSSTDPLDNFPASVSMHVFPKDEMRLQQWINAIPRENFKPSPHSYVCSLHFRDRDFQTERRDRNRSRNRGRGALTIQLLKEDAVPSLFSCLKDDMEEDSTGDSENINNNPSFDHDYALRVQDVLEVKMEPMGSPDSEQEDDLYCLSDLRAIQSLLPNVLCQEESDKMVFMHVDVSDDGFPAISYSMTIFEDLSYRLFVHGIPVTRSRLANFVAGPQLATGNEVVNILAKLAQLAATHVRKRAKRLAK